MRYLLVLLLGGCTTFNADNEHIGQHPKVSWIAVDDVRGFCFALIGKKVDACSIYTKSGTRCVIFTGKATDEQKLGHEVRHCFKGDFHE